MLKGQLLWRAQTQPGASLSRGQAVQPKVLILGRRRCCKSSEEASQTLGLSAWEGAIQGVQPSSAEVCLQMT